METPIIKTPSWYDRRIEEFRDKIIHCRAAISAAYPSRGGRPDYGAIQACRAEIDVYESRIAALRKEKENLIKGARK